MSIKAKATKIWCPVGELVGDPHTFSPSESVTVEWDVLGDSRQTVRVCAECAEPLKEENK